MQCIYSDCTIAVPSASTQWSRPLSLLGKSSVKQHQRCKTLSQTASSTLQAASEQYPPSADGHVTKPQAHRFSRSRHLEPRLVVVQVR